MRILLTGHKGFIGSALLLRLQKKHIVFNIDKADGLDLLDCTLDKEVDLVIHLAGESGVRQSFDNPAKYWFNNVEASRRLFNRYSNTRILYASSSSAYEPDLNPYAASKFCLEELAERHGNTVGMRFHTVWNETPRKGMFLQKLFDGELEYVTNHYRDFVHLTDVLDAIEILINKDYMLGEIDIGSGDPVKVCEFAPDLPIRLNTPGERIWTCANIEKIKALGWQPKYFIRKLLTNNNLHNIIKR